MTAASTSVTSEKASATHLATVRLAAGTAAAVLAVALVGGGLLYARTKLADVERLDLSGVLTGAASPGPGPMTVLVVGSDSRAGLSAADQELFGTAQDVGDGRADTIMVVRLDPDRGTAAALSLPRDLYVPIDGGDRVKFIAS